MGAQERFARQISQAGDMASVSASCCAVGSDRIREQSYLPEAIRGCDPLLQSRGIHIDVGALRKRDYLWQRILQVSIHPVGLQERTCPRANYPAQFANAVCSDVPGGHFSPVVCDMLPPINTRYLS